MGDDNEASEFEELCVEVKFLEKAEEILVDRDPTPLGLLLTTLPYCNQTPLLCAQQDSPVTSSPQQRLPSSYTALMTSLLTACISP